MDPERITRLMSLRDLAAAGQMAPDAAPLPVNTLRNNSTGAEYQIGQVPQGASIIPAGAPAGVSAGVPANSPQLDYSQPIEIFGQGRGYAIKGQPLSAMIDGRRVDYGVDSAATQQAQALAMKSAEQQQALDSGALDIGKKRLELAQLQATGGAKPLTESQGKAAGFGLRADDADANIRAIAAQDGVLQPGLIKRTAEGVPFIGEGLGTLANWTQSEPQQKVEQAQRNFINAVLRRESGAVISPEEFHNARQQYFPQIGDAPGTIAQKEANRQATIGAMKTESGTGYAQAKAEFEARKASIAGKRNDGGGQQVRASADQLDTLPDPRTEKGAIITDNSTGMRMQSDGRQWLIIGRGGEGGR